MTARIPWRGWDVFTTCPTCSATPGRPCSDLRSPNMGWYLRTPHAARRQLSTTRGRVS